MGQEGEFEWDDDKSMLLKQTRSYEIIDVAKEIFGSNHFIYQHGTYPEQLRAVGPAFGKLMTIV